MVEERRVFIIRISVLNNVLNESFAVSINIFVGIKIINDFIEYSIKNISGV